jgi:hypothetical protein
MSEIPEDILMAAEEALENSCHDKGRGWDERVNDIANAILAERERCARNESLLAEALQLHQMIFDSFRGYIPDFEEAVIILLRKAREP